MFLTSWLRSVSRRISLTKSRHGRHLSHKQRELLLHGPKVVSSHAEELEERCVLTPPIFISVSPNTGVFLADGSTLTEAPREVTFQFNPGQTLDATTLGAIHVVGAGYDGTFTSANVVTDLGTSSAAVLRLGVQRLGPADNGTLLDVNVAATGNGPSVAVVGGVLTLTLDSVTGTTAQNLIDFAATDAIAKKLLSVSLVSGSTTTNLTTGSGGTFQLSGAGAASAVSSFGASNLALLFTANQAGLDGNDIRLQINRLNLSNTDPTPRINVVGQRIEVTLNENTFAPTTAQALTDAINTHAAAKLLVRASIPVGSGASSIATVTDGTLIRLSGADRALNELTGFRGLESNNREVIYRFATPLDNDSYRFEVIGTGTAPLTNIAGEAVDGGEDSFLTVKLDLGATVTGVVPQPVLRQQMITVNNVANLTDGDTLTIDPGTGGSLFTFEFNSSGSVRTGNTAIAFTSGQATSIVAATI